MFDSFKEIVLNICFEEDRQTCYLCRGHLVQFKKYMALADPRGGGTRDAFPLLGQFLSLYFNFWNFLGQIISWFSHLWGWQPLSGKSWIRHWMDFKCKVGIMNRPSYIDVQFLYTSKLIKPNSKTIV